jgi:hypothetical protein
MTQSAGALSKILVGQTTASLSSAAATGGTGPYTYQWYRSTTTGFTAGAGNIISGATALTLQDSGLLANTSYYYLVATTDTGNSNVVVNSSQMTVLTEPSLSPNQFAQSLIVGLVDMTVGPTNVIAAQVDSSVANNAAPNNVILPGQWVKIVANTTGGIPKVTPITAKGDAVFGMVRFNVKDLNYTAGQNLEVAMWGSCVWCFATGAITQGAEVCADNTYAGGVQATGNTATYVGQALDGCAAAGLIRVLLFPNVAGTTTA